MAGFQGSGFTLQLPDVCADASAYAFVLPGVEGYAPNLTIRFEDETEPCDLVRFADAQIAPLRESVEGFEQLHRDAGMRGPNQGVMTTIEWGEGDARVRQRQLVLRVTDPRPRLFTLTTTDLAAHAAISDPLFDGMLRSFAPNNLQWI